MHIWSYVFLIWFSTKKVVSWLCKYVIYATQLFYFFTIKFTLSVCAAEASTTPDLCMLNIGLELTTKCLVMWQIMIAGPASSNHLKSEKMYTLNNECETSLTMSDSAGGTRKKYISHSWLKGDFSGSSSQKTLCKLLAWYCVPSHVFSSVPLSTQN